MKKYLILSLLFIALTACNSTKPTIVVKQKTVQTKEVKYRDGLSYETAIIAKNISFEYQWIRDHYPNYRVIRQTLQNNKKKYFDVLRIKNESDFEKDIYFNINSFFGKGF